MDSTKRFLTKWSIELVPFLQSTCVQIFTNMCKNTISKCFFEIVWLVVNILLLPFFSDENLWFNLWLMNYVKMISLFSGLLVVYEFWHFLQKNLVWFSFHLLTHRGRTNFKILANNYFHIISDKWMILKAWMFYSVKLYLSCFFYIHEWFLNLCVFFVNNVPLLFMVVKLTIFT